jgi:putative addiction module component (TIGR02574 family)
MIALAKADIRKMSMQERLQLVVDIWDSIAKSPENVRITSAQKTELDRRLAAYRKNPSRGDPWETVRDRIANKA